MLGNIPDMAYVLVALVVVAVLYGINPNEATLQLPTLALGILGGLARGHMREGTTIEVSGKETTP